MRFSIDVDMVRWLRGSNENRRRIIETRKISSYAIALNIEREAKSNIDNLGINDTRELRNNIFAIPTSIGATVLVNAPHAWFVEYGTGVHNTLGSGRKTPWVYRHRDGSFVTTPGRKATPFFNYAVEKTKLLSSSILRGAFESTRFSVGGRTYSYNIN